MKEDGMQDLSEAQGDNIYFIKELVWRKCLQCTKKFKSEHKFNRLCKKCNYNIERSNKDKNYDYVEGAPSFDWPVI
jgi:Zn finger protein HypA/HybF involved in hydrogenase expression